MLIRQQLRFALVESLKRYIVNREPGQAFDFAGIFLPGRSEIAWNRGRKGEC
jgi:hypothetical protein